MATHPLISLGAFKHDPLPQMNLYAKMAARNAGGGALLITLSLSALGSKCLRQL